MERLDSAVYRRAERLLRHNRARLVRGAAVRPRWIDGGPRFWYAADTAEGRRFVVADPEAGTREDARSSRPTASTSSSCAGTTCGRAPRAAARNGR